MEAARAEAEADQLVAAELAGITSCPATGHPPAPRGPGYSLAAEADDEAAAVRRLKARLELLGVDCAGRTTQAALIELLPRPPDGLQLSASQAAALARSALRPRPLLCHE